MHMAIANKHDPLAQYPRSEVVRAQCRSLQMLFEDEPDFPEGFDEFFVAAAGCDIANIQTPIKEQQEANEEMSRWILVGVFASTQSSSLLVHQT